MKNKIFRLFLVCGILTLTLEVGATTGQSGYEEYVNARYGVRQVEPMDAERMSRAAGTSVTVPNEGSTNTPEGAGDGCRPQRVRPGAV